MQQGDALPPFRPSVRLPDGLSADELRKSLDGIPSTLQGMRSPMGEPSRSQCVAGMDMLNDMFQRQARRLESQLYQRAQDQRTIEVARRQAQLAMARVRHLELQHQEQMARMQHGSQSLGRLQQQMREVYKDHEVVLAACEALQHDVLRLREALRSERPEAADKLRLKCMDVPPVEQLRKRAVIFEQVLREAERSTMEHVGATPTTPFAMGASFGVGGSSEVIDEQPSNPLHDLSVIADYASKARVSQAILGSPLCTARSLSQDNVDMDTALDVSAATRSL